MTDRPPTPGRPAAFSRDLAIEKAMNRFWRDGYLGVSASDLATAMEIQRSSFYNSFGSRETVFLEALERYTANAPDTVLDRLAPGDRVLPVMVAFFRELCRQRAADPESRGCLVCNSIGELVGVDENLGPVLRNATNARVDVLTRILGQAAEQGEWQAQGSVADAARAMLGFLLGINLLSKAVHDEAALWAACRSFLQGFGVPQGLLDATG